MTNRPTAIILGGPNQQHRTQAAAVLIDIYGYIERRFNGIVEWLLHDLNPAIIRKNNDIVHLTDVVDSCGWNEAITLFPEIGRLRSALRDRLPARTYKDVLTDALLTHSLPGQRHVFTDVSSVEEMVAIGHWLGPSRVHSIFIYPDAHTLVEVENFVDDPLHYDKTIHYTSASGTLTDRLTQHLDSLYPTIEGWVSNHA